MTEVETRLYNALKVLTEDDQLANYLAIHDPKAMEQVNEAMTTYEQARKPEWVVDLYVPFSCVPEGAESDVEAEALARRVFEVEGLYEKLLYVLEGTVFGRSDSELRTEVGC